MRASGYAVLAAMLAATPLAAQQDSTWRDHDRAARDARVRGDWAASRGHVDEWRPLYVSRFLAPGTWRRTEWTDSCFNWIG